MTKVTLDMSSFKALASDTRLNILKSLDGKKMNLKEISKSTDLNKATLHEHLTKLSDAGLVKRIERKGHKWVYYKLTWKGEGLLHPENTRIVVLFSLTFIALAAGIVQFIRYLTTKVSNTVSPSLSNNFQLYSELTDKSHNITTTPNENISIVIDNYISGSTSNFDLKIDLFNESVAPLLKKGIPEGFRNQVNESANATASNLDNGANFAAQQPSNLMHDPLLLYIAIGFFIIFASILCIAIWRYKKNQTPKL